jgi:peptidoglycan lytic transglycosylase
MNCLYPRSSTAAFQMLRNSWGRPVACYQRSGKPVLARSAVVLVVVTACFSVRAVSKQEVRTTNSRVQKGQAAFYSRTLEGHKTACGGRYVASELTTAHRSLPCGTKVRITNTKNGKSVEATVNDWGPTSRKRIVDVSRAVAEKLDFVEQGTTTVKVEIMK